MILDELEAFALGLQTLAQNHQHRDLEHYATDVLQDIQHFVLESAQAKLQDFPEQVAQLAGQTELKTGSLTDLGGKSQFGV